MPSTCLCTPTCLPCLLPPQCVSAAPGPIAPHVSSQPPHHPHHSPKSLSAPSLSCPLFIAPACPSCPRLLSYPPPSLSSPHPAPRKSPPSFISAPPGVSPSPGPCPLPVSPLTEEDAAGAGGPVRLHEAGSGSGSGAGRAVPSRAEPPRPAPAPGDRTKGSCGSAPQPLIRAFPAHPGPPAVTDPTSSCGNATPEKRPLLPAQLSAFARPTAAAPALGRRYRAPTGPGG